MIPAGEGYKAVFLGIGCHVGKPLGIPGEDAAGVVQGVEFLRRHNLGEPQEIGKRLAVIGGGNVAIDVACTARRLGLGGDHRLPALPGRDAGLCPRSRAGHCARASR